MMNFISELQLEYGKLAINTGLQSVTVSGDFVESFIQLLRCAKCLWR